MLGHGYVILVFLLGWVIFRADSLLEALRYIGIMFGYGAPEHALGWQHYLHNRQILVGIFALLLCYPWRMELMAKPGDAILVTGLKDIMIFGVLLLALMFMAAGTFTPFIYFKF